MPPVRPTTPSLNVGSCEKMKNLFVLTPDDPVIDLISIAALTQGGAPGLYDTI